ncbi:RNA 2'-phosphotransferase [Xanthomonas campestris]|uniref:RNA 2'-phosphotransferase n=1 Tax=Xanthomonas campestris TaxID=339 RepID=UPI002B22D82E|nr:RNA 2'-phosphotransferase [Xanthomonas campestris]MEA9709088.1 RNA 2'-phosphotransferase [Xanthomonas campestris pv. raphani]MEA9729106.1 RNA 2'-phosphotransferase [Xanthomonas campestris pv. raphani]MEA9902839.1 RNA 2'-phosphotransferase [Xanthomonas campestris pv. raphani]
MTKQHTDISKFLSFVLRHEPQAIGVTLDPDGWAEIDAVIAGAQAHGTVLDLELIQAVVAGSDKKRFALSANGRQIRAVQGHSTPTVALQFEAKVPPEVLYHGTATRFLKAILAEGLRAGQRHHVHLSDNTQTAASVGQRYGEPVVLQIDAGRMHRDGMSFFQADNGVWLTTHVPAAYVASPR